MSSITPRTPQNNPGTIGAGPYSFGPKRAEAAPEMTPKARSLVAGSVPGSVVGTANPVGAPAARPDGALAFYRHPADRNQAATAILAGRMLDVRG